MAMPRLPLPLLLLFLADGVCHNALINRRPKNIIKWYVCETSFAFGDKNLEINGLLWASRFFSYLKGSMIWRFLEGESRLRYEI